MMLSRTAAHLYWMSRYLERAENLARMMDVTHSLNMMPYQSEREKLNELEFPLLVTGNVDSFYEIHDSVDMHALVDFFVMREATDGGIQDCLRAARFNAHSVRGRISREMWEIVNTTWLQLREQQQGIGTRGIQPFFEWIKERSQLFRGSTYGNLLRDEAYAFLRLGTFVERADNTLRLLHTRAKLEEMLENQRAANYYAWNTLLDSLAAVESFSMLFRHTPDVKSVMGMLLLHPNMPRSLLCCVLEVNQYLSLIDSPIGRPAQRLSARMEADLRFTDIEEIAALGYADWIEHQLQQMTAIGGSIQTCYMEDI